MAEFETDISQELEQKMESTSDYYILLSKDPFIRQVYGELNADEEPPRYPFTIPRYKINVIEESQLAGESVVPYSFFIGKMNIERGIPKIYSDYLPPCMTIKSHIRLIEFKEFTEQFFGQLELDLLSIIRKIREKNQDTNLAQSVLPLSENLLRFVAENHLRLRWEIPNNPPIQLFIYIASIARVARNTIDLLCIL